MHSYYSKLYVKFYPFLRDQEVSNVSNNDRLDIVC